jgi:adenosylmethionine-8-amino-7-oxononanoate aminotransferase
MVPSPDARRSLNGETSAQCAERAATAIEEALRVRSHEIAAIIVEPLVQCAGGMVMHDPQYLRRVRALCDRYDVHFIADEIAVGFGRTGTFFAHEQAAVTPDFLCLSKGITGGYLPLSVVLTTDTVYDAFYDDAINRGFLHSHSYTGNPLACSAALAVLNIFRSDDVLVKNKAKADRFQAIAQSLHEHDRIENLRHRGMIWAFDVKDAPNGFSRRFAEAAMRENVLLRPIGATVYFMPPYVTSDDEFAQAVRASKVALEFALS